MADEVENPASAANEEGGLVVEVVPDRGKPQLSDGDVTKLDELPAEDEIGRYNQEAQKRIKNLHIANQEWRRRVVTANKDMATATTLAEQLYRENQELRANMGRSEQALIEQAIQRAEAQLEQAKVRAKAAISAGDPDAQIAANEEVSRYVAEADRLRLLKPAARTGAPAGGAEQATPSQVSPAPSAPQPQPQPVSEGVRNWISKNQWFGKPGEEEITGFALGIHQNLEKQGITENSDPERYWGTIDRRLREVYPDRFRNEPVEATPRRPVAVTGATRVNGGVTAKTPRQIRLSESQVRIAHQLGLTPEQYAAQLVKEDQANKGLVQ